MAEKATLHEGQRAAAIAQKTGYRGRLGIFELMLMTNKFRELAFEGALDPRHPQGAIAQGMTPLYHDGIRKVLNGTTTIEEVFRVSKKTEH